MVRDPAIATVVAVAVTVVVPNVVESSTPAASVNEYETWPFASVVTEGITTVEEALLAPEIVSLTSSPATGAPNVSVNVQVIFLGRLSSSFVVAHWINRDSSRLALHPTDGMSCFCARKSTKSNRNNCTIDCCIISDCD